jgi:hypothetical protein
MQSLENRKAFYLSLKLPNPWTYGWSMVLAVLMRPWRLARLRYVAAVSHIWKFDESMKAEDVAADVNAEEVGGR